jgi:hypothetical protein
MHRLRRRRHGLRHWVRVVRRWGWSRRRWNGTGRRSDWRWMGEAPRGGGVMDHPTAPGGVVSAGCVRTQTVSSSTLIIALG